MFSQEVRIGTLLFVVFLHGSLSTSLLAEKSSQAVVVKLYRIDTAQWPSKEAGFKIPVADQANIFCDDSPSSCGLLYWNSNQTFDVSNVVVEIVNVAESGKDLHVAVSILYPAGANVSSVSQTQYYLNKVATQTIVKNTRLDLARAVGTYVTYVGDEYFGIPPDLMANRAIIPIAFIVLVAVIVIAVGLHIWNRRKNGRKHVKREIDQSSKVTPIHIQQGATGKNIDTHHNLKGSNVNNTQKEVHQMQKVSPSPHSHPMHVNEFMDVDETRRNNTIPPLPAEEADSEHRKDKKRKKKKKKRHHRDSEDTTHDPNHSDTENRRKHSNKSHEHSNPTFWDSDP